MTSDPFSVRAVIVVVSAVVVGSAGTLCYLAIGQFEIPALLAGLVSTSLALLIPSPLTKAKTDEAVPVTTAPGDAVVTVPAQHEEL